ncbi:unnamed protein product [Bursaphelenchus okinawaensis]|uniref:Peptidase M14 domain-containing protein n=1 Tax=Bursaphelenchus okinawaensis TaxID=465554 RepID=A0A811K5K5_9BILA|nr:unnamed protein product [Bursaphelenchus okinawaensis]CAG9091852.1 unnamed protein product [Bursaphelenchus okinawaensis]
MGCLQRLVFIVSTVICAHLRYDNYRLYKFKSQNYFLEAVKREFEEDGHRLNSDGERMPLIDILKESDDYCLAIVSPEISGEFEDLAKRFDVADIKVVDTDIQRKITMERNEIIRNRRSQRRRRRNIKENDYFINFNDFHKYAKIVSFLQGLSVRFPEKVELLNISKTFEGRDLVGVKLSTPSSSTKPKPSIFIDAGIHAREWIAPAVALHLINTLVSDNEKTKWLTEEFDWYIVPVANPDGYEYSIQKDRLWRKTRSRNSEVNKWCIGADANRNWGYRWGEAGANRSPCSNIYAGSKPFSEPEVVGMKEFIDKNVNNLKVYASLHSYGQVFLSPWGYTSQKPENYKDQAAAAMYAIEEIKKTTGTNYTFGSIAEVMYPASGTSIDYMQDKGVPFIYGIELRPEDIDQSNGFSVDPKIIEPTGQEMVAAFTKIAQYVKGKLPRPVRLRYRRQ